MLDVSQFAKPAMGTEAVPCDPMCLSRMPARLLSSACGFTNQSVILYIRQLSEPPNKRGSPLPANQIVPGWSWHRYEAALGRATAAA